jgi:hypothetical protein
VNRGVVVGKVFDAQGRPAKSAYVAIYQVTGNSGRALLEIEKFDARADSKGSFKVPFLWKPTDWASDLSTVYIRTVAYTEEGDLLRDGSSRQTANIAQWIKGYVVRDILQPINIASGNPFESVPDLADFAIGIGQALAHYKDLVPFWKVSQVASTEGWVIGAGAYLYLR